VQLLNKPNHEIAIVLYGSSGALPSANPCWLCCAQLKFPGPPTQQCFALLPGVADTQNEPHEEAKAGGDDAQYLSVQVLRNLVVPDLAALRAVQNLPRGTGRH
jgi:hypothetical protein